MNPVDLASFNHRIKQLSTGRTYHLVAVAMSQLRHGLSSSRISERVVSVCLIHMLILIMVVSDTVWPAVSDRSVGASGRNDKSSEPFRAYGAKPIYRLSFHAFARAFSIQHTYHVAKLPTPGFI